MSKELNAKLAIWKETRHLTLDLLNSLNDEQLKLSIPNMGTLGKQFRHMGDVELCYAHGIESGKIDFSKKRKDYSLETSKKKPIRFLEEVDGTLAQAANDKPSAVIDWGHAKIPLSTHFDYLIGHEHLHWGQWIVYFRILGLKFPKSWQLNWGLK